MPDPSVLALLHPPPGRESKVERVRRMLAATFSPGFLEQHGDLALELELIGNRYTTDETVKWHRIAVGKLEAYERLRSIEISALVLHGTEDPVIPIENGQIRTGQISNSKFLSLEGVGHLPATEKPVKTASITIEFCIGQ